MSACATASEIMSYRVLAQPIRWTIAYGKGVRARGARRRGARDTVWFGGGVTPQLAALLTSVPIFSSTSPVNLFSA